MLAAFLLALIACNGSTSLDDVREVPPIPAPALAACAAPVLLPQGPLTQSEAEGAWLQDRLALRTCEDRRLLLSDYAKQLRESFVEAFGGEG